MVLWIRWNMERLARFIPRWLNHWWRWHQRDRPAPRLRVPR